MEIGKILGLLVVTLLLTSCSATHTYINKRNLDVQTKMSASVFLDPIPLEKRTVYLQVRNTSDKQEMNLGDKIKETMLAKGYTVVENPEQAHYILQANVLQVGRTDLRAAEHALNRGFGAALTGAAIGAGLGSLTATGKNAQAKRRDRAIVGGLMGATVATVTDAMVQDVVYSAIADVQVSERVANSHSVKEKTRTKLVQGTNGTKEITSTEKIDWKRYQTRVVATANKVNLKFEKAANELAEGLSRSISGIF